MEDFKFTTCRKAAYRSVIYGGIERDREGSFYAEELSTELRSGNMSGHDRKLYRAVRFNYPCSMSEGVLLRTPAGVCVCLFLRVYLCLLCVHTRCVCLCVYVCVSILCVCLCVICVHTPGV